MCKHIIRFLVGIRRTFPRHVYTNILKDTIQIQRGKMIVQMLAQNILSDWQGLNWRSAVKIVAFTRA